jgi:CRISPR-associated protein Cas8a1/Csx13
MNGEELKIELSAPGMTALHRAGLGGLWMTLVAIEKQQALASRLRAVGGWERGPRAVTLRWTGSGEDFFNELIRAAYPITEHGLLCFLADDDPLVRLGQAWNVHTAMLQTFLQHPRTRRLAPGGASSHLPLEIDGKLRIFSFRPVLDHQFRSVRFHPDRPGPVVGWLFPGGAVRHVGLGSSTNLVEPPERLLALRFGPIGCVFYHVRHIQPGKGWRRQSALAVPELEDLERFAAIRRIAAQSKLADLYTAGAGDAALRLMLLEAGQATARRIRPQGCEVTTFDTVAWSPRQRSRTSVVRVTGHKPQAERAYAVVRRALRSRPIAAEDGSVWFSVPQLPELAGENTLAARPWWHGFAAFVSLQGQRQEVMRYEREGLRVIVADREAMPDGPERTFIEACHEAWRRRLGELGGRSRREGIQFHSLADREFERWRIRFAHSKTAADFRGAITDFWSRSGPQQSLRESWIQMLPFLDSRRWQEGRDLALLALVSYGRPAQEETEETAEQLEEAKL